MKYLVTLNGTNYEVEVRESEVSLLSSAPAPAQTAAPAPVQAAAPAPSAPQANVSAEGTKVVSPMPGTILQVKVSQGSAVKAGDTIIVLEAMKMENDIVAPADGTVKQLLVSKGSNVATDDVLAVIG